MTDVAKTVNLRRFSIFDYMSLVCMLIPIAYAVYEIRSSDFSIGQSALIVICTAISYFVWFDMRHRLSIVGKDMHLIADRGRAGYHEDLWSNAKIALIESVVVAGTSLFIEFQWILLLFVGLNLGLLAAEMTIYAEEKPAIKEQLSNENAKLRAQIISVFYNYHREALLAGEQFESAEQYLVLSELDYYLNHMNLSEDDYRDLRARLDDTNLDRELDVNFFLFKISCEALRHSFENEKTEQLCEMKERTIRSSKFRSVYDVMRYLD